MKRILFGLLLIAGVAKAQTPQTGYIVTSISAMKTYFGAANRLHVDATNEDFKICSACSADESTVYAGAGGRKWKKITDPKKVNVGDTAAAFTPYRNAINTTIAAQGLLSGLNTTAKGNLVAAINEVKATADAAVSGNVPADGTITNAKLATDVKVGSLATLSTTAKASVVAAINEVKASASGLNTGDETAATIKAKLGITNLSGSNNGDQDLSAYATTANVNTALAVKANTSSLGTAAVLNVPASGNAAIGEVVKGNDTRLTDARTPVSHSADLITDGTTNKAYTAAEKTKLAGVATGATNVNNTNQLINGAGFITTTAATEQSHTSGATVTVTSQTTDIWLLVNPASTIAALTITTPATPVDGQRLDISFGGTMTSGNVVTSFTLTANTGQSLINPPSGSVEAGETISIRYKTSLTKWFRIL